VSNKNTKFTDKAISLLLWLKENYAKSMSSL